MGGVSERVEALPWFRYHPDPVETGNVEPRDAACVVCGRSRGWVYVGPVYAVDELDERICPWCISDGSAAARYDAVFTDAGHALPADVPQQVLDEVERRTPGFTGWQQEHWLYHCGDAAAFLGRAGWPEIQGLPDVVQMLRDEQAGYGWSARELDEYLTGLEKDGASTVYLFRCLHCDLHLAYSDFE